MKDFLREDLKCKEIPSKPQEKDPYHYHIWDFAYFAYFFRYGHQYLTCLPWKFMSKLFFLEKVWLRNTLPTYNLDMCLKLPSSSSTSTSTLVGRWLCINFVKSSTHPPTTTHPPGLVVNSNYNVNLNFINNSNLAWAWPSSAPACFLSFI